MRHHGANPHILCVRATACLARVYGRYGTSRVPVPYTLEDNMSYTCQDKGMWLWGFTPAEQVHGVDVVRVCGVSSSGVTV